MSDSASRLLDPALVDHDMQLQWLRRRTWRGSTQGQQECAIREVFERSLPAERHYSLGALLLSLRKGTILGILIFGYRRRCRARELEAPVKINSTVPRVFDDISRANLERYSS